MGDCGLRMEDVSKSSGSRRLCWVMFTIGMGGVSVGERGWRAEKSILTGLLIECLAS